jgi:hypothetical protein
MMLLRTTNRPPPERCWRGPRRLGQRNDFHMEAGKKNLITAPARAMDSIFEQVAEVVPC